LLFPRILQGRVVLMFHRATSRVGTVTCPVIGPENALFLRRKLFKAMYIGDMLTSPLLKRSLLERWSLPVSFL
jgi:hypothetical protein